MARVSRKNKPQTSPTPVTKTVEKKPKVNTGIYVRLSVEQEDDDQIQTQIEFISDYISKKEDLFIKEIYIDHGFSGTTMYRPEFNRMMKDAQRGVIDCIVVKDLSRFGRNYLEVGYYIEMILPKINCRFIAINDDYDSAYKKKDNDLSIPLKNMINEMYAKDMSKKICKSNEAKRKNGTATIISSVYGYKVDKEKNKYHINPETASVVQLIFRWFMDGRGCVDIANRLNYLGIETPFVYKYKNEYKKKPYKESIWNQNKVHDILTNEFYQGDRYVGTRTCGLYRNQREEKLMPKDKWIKYKDDHDPLVSREDFYKVQKMVENSPHSAKNVKKREYWRKPAAITPLVYCKLCDTKMILQRLYTLDREEKEEGNIYVCKGTPAKGYSDGCHNKINVDYLNIIVNEQIKNHASQAIDYNRILKKLQRNKEKSYPVLKYENMIRSISMKIDTISTKIEDLYVDFSNGIIDDEDFHKIKANYKAERKDLEGKLEQTKLKIKEAEEALKSFEKTVHQLEQYLEKGIYSDNIVKNLIDRIDVYDSRKVEITFKFQDIYKQVADYLEEKE